MEDSVRNALTAYGMDVDATIARFGGNEKLLLKYLARFPDDPSYASLETALAEGRRDDAGAACHTLKGICGNLGLTPLFDACVKLMAALRESDATDITLPLQTLREAYGKAVDMLRGCILQ